MKSPFKSIRWRLQAWHGLLLFIVLLAFGLRSYHLTRDSRLSVVDRKMVRQSLLVPAVMADSPQRTAIFGAIDKALSSYDWSSTERPKSQPRNRLRNVIRETLIERLESDIRLSNENPDFIASTNENSLVARLLASSERAGFYYILWQPDGSVLTHSGNAPTNIPSPAPDRTIEFQARTRDTFREQSITATNGTQLLVGYPIEAELASLNELAFRLAMTGCVILVLGLLGGWWMSRRVIRPINEISTTATEIASGNLAERINVSDTDSELGQLATVLNTSFDQVQAAFNQLQAALERQVRFTADASHELRTPVSVVLAEANSALARERTSAEYREGFESCRQAARQMRQLTESLLVLARLDAEEQQVKQEPCDLKTIAFQSVNLLRPLAEARNIKLHTELGDGSCLGDAGQLGQVVTNLVSNAIQYNHPGGEVRVKLSSEGWRTVVLNVTDTGRGIAAEDLPHIFDRFYQADKSRSQTDGHVGLGLAITKAIVEAHAGTICVTSEIGCGTIVTATFKRFETTAEQKALREQSATSVEVSQK